MGRYRGGQGKIAVVGSALFGMISGSAVANVSAVGVVTIPLMQRAGFPPRIAAAVEAVGSTGGQLMPPVMGAAAFLIAEYLQVPYGDVIVAATIPAILYYFSLFAQVDLEAAARGIAGAPSATLPRIGEVLYHGWHFIVPFVVIVVGLLVYNMQPEYAAMLAVAVLIPICLLRGYRGRRIGVVELLSAIASTGSAILDIVLICATAGVVIGILNLSGLAFGLTLNLVSLTGSNLPLLLLVAAGIAILLGLGLPTVGVYVLMATLVAPALIKLGVPPMSAHMFVMYFGMMSMITPPIALAAYAAANIARTDPVRTGLTAARVGWIAYIVPFLIIYDPALMMIGTPAAIVWALLTNCLGVWCGTAAVVGFARGRLGPVSRIAFLVAALCLLFPGIEVTGGLIANGVGIVLAAALIAQEFWRSRGSSPALAEAAADPVRPEGIVRRVPEL